MNSSVAQSLFLKCCDNNLRTDILNGRGGGGQGEGKLKQLLICDLAKTATTF